MRVLESGVNPWDVRVAGEGELPTRAYPGDAGFDLHCKLGVPAVIYPGEFRELSMGLDVQPPDGCWLLVVGRSSTFQRGLLVNSGVVDSGYRGKLVIWVRNVSQGKVVVQPGERLAQMIPMPQLQTSAVRVDSLDPSERGSNGFGSSGK